MSVELVPRLEAWIAASDLPQEVSVTIEGVSAPADPYRGSQGDHNPEVVIAWASSESRRLAMAGVLVVFGLMWTVLWIAGEAAALVGLGAPVLFGLTAANVYVGATQVRIDASGARVVRRGVPSSTKRSLSSDTVKHLHIQHNDPHHEGGITTYTVMALPHEPWHLDDNTGEYLLVVPDYQRARLIVGAWQLIAGCTATDGPMYDKLAPATPVRSADPT